VSAGGSAQIASVLVVGGAIGEMAVPLLLVLLFRSTGDANLGILMPVLTAVCSANVGVLATFVWVRGVGPPAGERWVGSLTPARPGGSAHLWDRQLGRPVLAARKGMDRGSQSGQYMELGVLSGADGLDVDESAPAEDGADGAESAFTPVDTLEDDMTSPIL